MQQAHVFSRLTRNPKTKKETTKQMQQVQFSANDDVKRQAARDKQLITSQSD